MKTKFIVLIAFLIAVFVYASFNSAEVSDGQKPSNIPSDSARIEYFIPSVDEKTDFGGFNYCYKEYSYD